MSVVSLGEVVATKGCGVWYSYCFKLTTVSQNAPLLEIRRIKVITVSSFHRGQKISLIRCLDLNLQTLRLGQVILLLVTKSFNSAI